MTFVTPPPPPPTESSSFVVLVPLALLDVLANGQLEVDKREISDIPKTAVVNVGLPSMPGAGRG